MGAKGVMLAAVIALLTSRCAGYVQPKFELSRHLILVDENGSMLRTHDTAEVRKTGDVAPRRPLSDSMARVTVSALMDEIRRSPNDTITLFLHGGLVSHTGAYDKARDLSPPLLADGHYPLFVGWEAGWFPTLADHLKSVRQGHVWKPIFGYLSMPLVIAADVLRGAGRSPLGLLQQTADYCAAIKAVGADSTRRARGIHSCGAFSDAAKARRVNIRRVLNERQGGRAATTATDPLSLTLGGYEQQRVNDIIRVIATLPTLPVKIAATGPIVDGFGAGAYENMRRRTQTMFISRVDLTKPPDPPTYRAPSGAMSILLDSLDTVLRSDCSRANMCGRKLIVAGHSMGTIIAARMLREKPHLPIAKLYFMAAAASLSEVVTSVIPYLREHPETRFYNGTLHPRVEVGEAQWKFLDLVPRGTLLEWIDDYLTSPETPLDRTAGKWENVAAAAFLFPAEMRPRVMIKGFGYKDARDKGNAYLFSGLKSHGSFSNPKFGFWRDATWCLYTETTCTPAKPGIPPEDR